MIGFRNYELPTTLSHLNLGLEDVCSSVGRKLVIPLPHRIIDQLDACTWEGTNGKSGISSRLIFLVVLFLVVPVLPSSFLFLFLQLALLLRAAVEIRTCVSSTVISLTLSWHIVHVVDDDDDEKEEEEEEKEDDDLLASAFRALLSTRFLDGIMIRYKHCA